MKNKSIDIKSMILLHVILLIYSFSSVFSKIASTKEFMSMEFILFYGLVVVILGIYALLWQQVLKRMPLTTAFSNKAVVTVWGMIWGSLFFHEEIKWYMILGIGIIIIGVVMVVSDNDR